MYSDSLFSVLLQEIFQFILIFYLFSQCKQVREVFVRESKVVIIKKLNEFKSKLDLGLMSLTEIEDQLRKLYNCFRNLVSKAAHNINNK